MSQPETPRPDGGDELQFDHAEYEGPASETATAAVAATCAACKQSVPESYFEVNGAILCPNCRKLVEASLTGGSGLVRFLRATIFGLGAAVAGFAIYFGVMKIANLEIGLISILVGFMVGIAVRKGSQGRGGWAYQALAIFLTYSAIAASYSAVVVPGLVAEWRQKSEAAKAAEKAEAPEAEAGANPRAASPAQMVAGLFLLVGVALAFCYAIPVLAGIQSPIGLLIVAFALWEAWKLNRRMVLRITGPYRVGDAAGAAGLEGAAANA